MIRDEIALLLYEARRKPAVAALVDRVTDMSDEDIAAADVPLPWFRKALTALREKKRIETMDIEYILRANPDPVGQVWRWNSLPIFLKIGTSSIEIKEGQLIWVGETEFWLETVRGNRIEDWDWASKFAEKIGLMTRSEYNLARRERLLGMKAHCATPVEEKPLFRIIRH